MSETLRIWKESGLKFLYRPVAPPLHHTTPSLSDRVKETENCFPPSSHFPISRWTLPFQEYWKKVHQPCSAIITYLNLDDDFRGSPNYQRLELLHSIIKAMSWPPQHIAFWPPILQGPDAPLQSVSMICFRELIEVLTPRYIFCFGNPAHQLFSEFLPHLTGTNPANPLTRLVLLPSLEDMLPDNKLVKKEAWKIIRTLTI